MKQVAGTHFNKFWFWVWKGNMFLHLTASNLVPLIIADRVKFVDFILKKYYVFPEQLPLPLLMFSLFSQC